MRCFAATIILKTLQLRSGKREKAFWFEHTAGASNVLNFRRGHTRKKHSVCLLYAPLPLMNWLTAGGRNTTPHCARARAGSPCPSPTGIFGTGAGGQKTPCYVRHSPVLRLPHSGLVAAAANSTTLPRVTLNSRATGDDGLLQFRAFCRTLPPVAPIGRQ